MDKQVPPNDPLPTRTEAEGATVDLPAGTGFFAVGQVLGDRYEILEMLGRGGMGEVWRAFDLKLRVEVGLKALREELFQSERRLELLRQEVRAAREVVSPNVCRIFDLIEIEGRELVSMEYVDGATLLGVLQERGPLELKEAQDIASQFLAGLEAIHKAGLVHRDVKPENIMLTRAGRVVVMDFGLARGPESGAGSVSGTPAYMAPEHAAGGDVDARADVYSAGVVLAEMVSPEGIKSYQSRQSVWEGVRSEPAKIPNSPWAPVIKRAVARDRERRQNSAHTLIRELEDVTLRVEGADDLHPYPGLASFTEEDAEYFFGREAEVEHMWRKLEGPARMLAIAGPSGAGKTSFLQAGLVPHAQPGWGIVRCTPGTAPINALAGALAGGTAGNPDAVRRLLRFHEPNVAVEIVSNWRSGHHRAMLIVDQFEELFTLNPPEVQHQVAELLNRLVLDSDIFVLLSLRDDFLFQCHRFEGLRPGLTELTMLGPPEGGALRRALVQPATKCGYRFEDDDLVEEILTEVESERGALPILAFALARLWEKRDRETGLLTRQAYHDIGGVGGALARHAESTIDRIGVERIPIVRELFRNLVTAEGTRAVREWDELLSVFERSALPSVAGEKVRRSALPSVASEKVRRSALPPVASEELGVRRLTSHSEQSERSRLTPNSERSERSPLTANEVSAHSSPARAAASEVLRELIDARLLTSYEVREDEQEPIRRVEIIHESLLANWPRLVRWQTQDQEGAQLRDELRQAARSWNEHGRHDDRLWTGTAYREYQLWRERYPGGLTEIEEEFARAVTSFATKRKRRRRIAVTASFAVLFIVLVVVGALWRRSLVETRRAEAAGLLSQARVELATYPSASVAYAIASLELSDSLETRQLALSALWKGPTAFVVNEIPSWEIGFTPDAQHLIQSTDSGPYGIHVHDADGSDHLLEDIHEGWIDLEVSSTSSDFATLPTGRDPQEPIALWSASDKRLLATGRKGYPDGVVGRYVDHERQRVLLVVEENGASYLDALSFQGKIDRLGSLPVGPGSRICSHAPEGSWTAVTDGTNVYQIIFSEDGTLKQRHLDHISGPMADIECDPLGRFVAVRHEDGPIALWDLNGESRPTTISSPPTARSFSISPDGSLLQAITFGEERAETWVWSLDEIEPALLRRVDLGKASGSSGWTLDYIGRRIISIFNPDTDIRVWPLGDPADADPLIVYRGKSGFQRRVEVLPGAEWFAASYTNGLTMWPMARSYPSAISQYNERFGNIAFGPNGEWLVTSSINGPGTVRYWNLEGDGLPASNVVREAGTYAFGLATLPDGDRVLFGKFSGVELLSVKTGEYHELPDAHLGFVKRGLAVSRDGRYGAAGTFLDATNSVITVWDLESRETIRTIDVLGEDIRAQPIYLDERTLLTAGSDGLFRWDLDTLNRESILDEYMITGVADVTGSIAALFVTQPGHGLTPHGSALIVNLETGTDMPLHTHGDLVAAVAMDRTGSIVVTGDKNGVIRVGSTTGEEPHLLLGSGGYIYFVAIDPKGRWIASSALDNVLRLWPMPDLSKPPLHTLPRAELIAKLKTLTNLRVVRDEESATGWKLTHDPFPGWETVPTW